MRIGPRSLSTDWKRGALFNKLDGPLMAISATTQGWSVEESKGQEGEAERTDGPGARHLCENDLGDMGFY